VSWTPDELKAVGKALIGSWPGTIPGWGREAFSAYLGELQARSLTAEATLVAIRSWPAGSDFPPSAPNLAAAARHDPERPTFEELLAGLYGPGGMFGFKRSNVTISPWVVKFAEGQEEHLRQLPIDDEDEGKWRRRELEEAWQRFLEATEGRAIHEIAARSGRGTLGRIDPLAAIGAGKSTELMEGE
jgi:hypothetical protein